MKKHTILLTIILFILIIFSGCKQAKAPVTKTGLYFDTVISITLYESNSSKLIDECFNIADNYEQLFSKTIPESDVSKVNNSTGFVKINKETFDLITNTFQYEEMSNGKFSVMCGALVDLWDISGRSAYVDTANTSSTPNKTKSFNKSAKSEAIYNPENIIPSSKEIEHAISLCGKDKLDIDSANYSVRINTPGAKLDLGAVAKGYVADKMKEYLTSQGVESGIIQLGGNVLTIGHNPNKEDQLFTIGITTPFSDNNDIITTVKTSGESVVTSGNYQRYFKYEGQIYHHIIDLTTGYPANTKLNSVTVVCDSSTTADIMSTVLFLSGKEKGAELSDSLNLTDVVFIDDNNNITP